MHLKTLKMIATSGFLTALECTKFVFGRGSAPDPTGGAHDAPPDPLVGWGGGYPLPIPHPLDAFGVSVSSPTATRPRAINALCPTLLARGIIQLHSHNLAMYFWRLPVRHTPI